MSQRKWLAHASTVCLAGMLATRSVLATGASVDSATKTQLRTATEHYDRGVDAMDAEKYAEALAQFQQSYDAVASPNSRMMVGRALVKLGKLPEAYRELSLALKQATELAVTQKRYKKTGETVQKELDEIQGKLAYVMIRHAAHVQLQGESIAPANWQEPQPVMPGKVTAVIDLGNGRQERRVLTLKPGDRVELALDAPASTVSAQQTTTSNQVTSAPVAVARSSSELNRRNVGYAVGAVGIAGIGDFVGLSLILAPSYGNSKAGCVNSACPESGIDNETSKATLRGAGYVGLGIGVLGLGIGTWLVFSGGTKTEPSSAIRLGPAGVELTQRF